MPKDISQQLQLARSRAERLKKARDEAERLLEQKSRELYAANNELELAQKGLEDDIKQATYELSVSNRRLQTALNERSTFIGQMSHEVRTPLNAILGLSEILLTTELDETQFDYVDTIKTAARSLTVLLGDMLDITQIEAGKLKVNLESVDTQRLHRNVVSMFEMEANEKGLSINLSIQPSVPASLRLDKGRYRQILNNLVSNAIKNTDKGAVDIDIEYLSNKYSNGIGMLSMKVKDTGVGIPKHKLKTIFNAYEQLGTSSQGVGLGLAICSQLCDLMQGTIHCESELGRGSLFEVSLPAEALNEDQEIAKNERRSQREIAQPTLKILVAEDNLTNQKVLAAQLAQLGHSATIVDNGAQAIECLQGESYDIVFLDILMPVMDGEQTLATIRRSDDRIASHYCVALTASNYQEQRQRLLGLGFDKFLGKPLGLTELAEVLDKTVLRLNLESVEQGDGNGLSDSTPFDYDYLRSQFGDLAETIFAEIAPTFLEHTGADFNALESALNKGRVDEARKLSHSIKGGAASMGLMSLASKLELMEQKASSASAHTLFEEIRALWGQIEPQVLSELHRLNH